MNREQAKEELKSNLLSYVSKVTKPSKGGLFVCPLCGSGEGHNGTGAFSINKQDSKSWKCFSCLEVGDIFELYGQLNRITDFRAQLEGVADIFGFSLDALDNNYQSSESISRESITQEPKQDYTDFFLQANKSITSTDYPQTRGLSQEVLGRFKIGYVAEWQHPKAPTAPASPRLIIPTSKHSYLARDVRSDIPDNQKSYSKLKVGDIAMFNLPALQQDEKPIFVVEGEIDALSIIEAGGEAVALGTIAKTKDFLKLFDFIDTPSQPLIIAMDNDSKGNQARDELTVGLESLDISFYVANPAGVYKDANEALTSDKKAFFEAVAHPENIEDKLKEAEKEAYITSSAGAQLQDFLDGITANADTPSIATGFTKFDKVLDGGLYEGLYFIGAISSLGKTTLALQIMDQLAQSEQDVLLFSLEMAQNELMSKSISRHTLTRILENGGDMHHAKTARGITDGKRYVKYSKSERENIKESVKEYGCYANRIFISEGVGNIGVEEIRQHVERHIKITGNRPIVLIDYVQILAPYNERSTDKQNTDKAVLELKRISRDYKIPMIAISSLNRQNYNSPISMEAFKESGAVEYSSDVLIGLQLKGVGTTGFDVNEAKAKSPREIELVILKNRNGRTGDKLPFTYYPLFNYFKEDQGGQA